MSNYEKPVTRAFVKQLFEDAYEDGAGSLALELSCFGESGSETLSVGPHPGFHRLSFVMSFGSKDGGGYQCAFSADDSDEVKQFIAALQGWLDFVDEPLTEEKKDEPVP